jgi:hypothetical protein
MVIPYSNLANIPPYLHKIYDTFNDYSDMFPRGVTVELDGLRKTTARKRGEEYMARSVVSPFDINRIMNITKLMKSRKGIYEEEYIKLYKADESQLLRYIVETVDVRNQYERSMNKRDYLIRQERRERRGNGRGGRRSNLKDRKSELTKDFQIKAVKRMATRSEYKDVKSKYAGIEGSSRGRGGRKGGRCRSEGRGRGGRKGGRGRSEGRGRGRSEGQGVTIVDRNWPPRGNKWVAGDTNKL